MSENAPENVEGGQWWSRPSFVVCAMLVALGVALALVLPLWPDRGDGNAAAEPSPRSAPAAPGPGVTEDASDSVCGLDASTATSLTKAPKADWSTAVGAISIPRSKSQGPGVEDEQTGVRSCFAQSPEGAVLAAANLLGASGDADVLAQTIEQRSVDSPGKEVALSQVADVEGGAPPIQFAGFRLLNYSPERATVEIVAEVDNGSGSSLLTTGVDLVWVHGDWYSVYGDDGTGGPVSGQVSNLNGYTKWGPNNGG